MFSIRSVDEFFLVAKVQFYKFSSGLQDSVPLVYGVSMVGLVPTLC